MEASSRAVNVACPSASKFIMSEETVITNVPTTSWVIKIVVMEVVVPTTVVVIIIEVVDSVVVV